jgi:hypothetical protein
VNGFVIEGSKKAGRVADTLTMRATRDRDSRETPQRCRAISEELRVLDEASARRALIDL